MTASELQKQGRWCYGEESVKRNEIASERVTKTTAS